jgi:hypothetical protein
MHKSLLRGWTDVGDAAHGFLRDDANLVVIFVTDEVDCSHNSEFDTAFLPNGNRVFWSNPDEGQPTSAVCWNAGVECSGAGDPYTECHSQGYDVDGNLAASPDTAVLHPLDRYTSILQDVQAGKTAGRVHLFGIVGVDDSGSATYQDSVGDPVFQEDFGIGSGCGSPIGTAVPPVRLRELIETIDGTAANNLTSICGSDYGPALTNLAQRIVDNTL